VVLLVVFARLIGSPELPDSRFAWRPPTLQKLGSQLDAQNISHETGADAKSITVPGNKLDVGTHGHCVTGLAAVTSARASSSSTKWSVGGVRQPRISVRRSHISARSKAKLERSIETLSDVSSARVHLVMATTPSFSTASVPPKRP